MLSYFCNRIKKLLRAVYECWSTGFGQISGLISEMGWGGVREGGTWTARGQVVKTRIVGGGGTLRIRLLLISYY